MKKEKKNPISGYRLIIFVKWAGCGLTSLRLYVAGVSFFVYMGLMNGNVFRFGKRRDRDSHAGTYSSCDTCHFHYKQQASKHQADWEEVSGSECVRIID